MPDESGSGPGAGAGSEEVLAGFAELDLDRARRRGYPEAVYCRGKTPGQVGVIAAALRRAGARTLFTRASPAHAQAVLTELPAALHAALQTAGYAPSAHVALRRAGSVPARRAQPTSSATKGMVWGPSGSTHSRALPPAARSASPSVPVMSVVCSR